MQKENLDKEYDKIFQNMKDEKMDWSFEDFLEKTNTNESPKIYPLKKKFKIRIELIAACLLLAFGLYFFINQNTKENFYKKQLTKKIPDNKPSELAQIKTDSLSPSKDSLKNPEKEVRIDELEQILPKKQRLKKHKKELLAQHKTNLPQQETLDEHQVYVEINGQKILNKEDAIDVTKYSIQLFSKKMNETVATTFVQDFSNDY